MHLYDADRDESRVRCMAFLSASEVLTHTAALTRLYSTALIISRLNCKQLDLTASVVICSCLSQIFPRVVSANQAQAHGLARMAM